MYPPPSYALTVWYTPRGICVALPGRDCPGHTVCYADNEAGLLALHQLLRDRAIDPTATVGTDGSPVQHSVEKLTSITAVMQDIARKERERTAAQARNWLEENGL